VSDELWARIEPLLPVVPRRADHPGRKQLDDRKVLCGIRFVLHTGIPWEFLPQELGCGSGMTAWRRLRDWHHAGVLQRRHENLLAALNAADALDWSRAVIDAAVTAIAVQEPFTDGMLDGLLPLLQHKAALGLWQLVIAARAAGRSSGFSTPPTTSGRGRRDRAAPGTSGCCWSRRLSTRKCRGTAKSASTSPCASSPRTCAATAQRHTRRCCPPSGRSGTTSGLSGASPGMAGEWFEGVARANVTGRGAVRPGCTR
jgi:transposase